MFNPRQLLVHAPLSAILISNWPATDSQDAREQALGAFQQYLRNQSMFCVLDIRTTQLEPLFRNPNYAPKARCLENWLSDSWARKLDIVSEESVEGLEWASDPWELLFLNTMDTSGRSTKSPGRSQCCPERHPLLVSSECRATSDRTFDLVITDPPFGDNIFYSDLANFFYAWLRLPLRKGYPDLFDAVKDAQCSGGPCTASSARRRGQRLLRVRADRLLGRGLPCSQGWWVAGLHIPPQRG